jgi:hypothetical protein
VPLVLKPVFTQNLLDFAAQIDSSSAMTSDYIDLLGEVPLLLRARAFADGLRAAPLFSRTGESLDAQDLDLADRYVQNLGFAHVAPARLLHLAEALGAAEAADDDPETWGAEEQLRAALHLEALTQISEEGANALLQLVAAEASETARDRAMEAFSHSAHASDEVVNCLVGHVAQAAHCMALAILADVDQEQPDHPFVLRWSLFNRGRWPVGITGATYNIL